MFGGSGGRVAGQLCAWFTCRSVSAIQILVCLTIPLATNRLLDFHMAKSAPCNRERFKLCIVEVWAQGVPKAHHILTGRLWVAKGRIFGKAE